MAEWARQDSEAARLIRRYQAGDAGAFDELYRRYFASVHNYARMALGDHHEAEDVAQNVFAAVLGAIQDYDALHGPPFRSWLLQIARNRVIDVARRRSHLVPEEPQLMAQLSERDGLQWNEELLARFGDGDVAVFVKRLPETQREVLVLRYMLDLSLEEAAEVLGRSYEAVRKLQERALATLEQRLSAIGERPRRSRRAPALTRIRPAPVLAARRFALVGNFVPAGRMLSARQPWALSALAKR